MSIELTPEPWQISRQWNFRNLQGTFRSILECLVHPETLNVPQVVPTKSIEAVQMYHAEHGLAPLLAGWEFRTRGNEAYHR